MYQDGTGTCDQVYSDSAGTNDLTDQATEEFLDVSQSSMNTWLSIVLVLLVALTNEWKVVRQPICTEVENHGLKEIGHTERGTFRSLSSTTLLSTALGTNGLACAGDSNTVTG